jgi:hypothetical protein
VGKILYNFESAEIQTWVYAEEDRLAGLDFNAFIVELKKKFLPRTWERTLVRDQIALQGESTFVAWVDRVIAANTELRGATSVYYIEPDKLRLHLIPRMRPALERAYHANNLKPNATATTGILNAIADFADWKECVNVLDIELTEKNEEWVDRLSKMATKPRSAAPSRPSNTQRGLTVEGGLSGVGKESYVGVPKLTREEKDILKAHLGCYKCRTFYVGHFSPDCD